MNKTIYLKDRRNENKLATIVKGKCRTIMYNRSDNGIEVDIRGISFKDWFKVSPDIARLVIKDKRAII